MMNPIPLSWVILSLLCLLLMCHPQTSCTCWGFAAASKKAKGGKTRRGGTTASNHKGFGVQPPTFEQVVSGMKTRLPPDASTQPCPCGSGNVYGDCCQPFHSGQTLPEKPVQVLQSRYSAFYYRIVPYIIQTTHPTCQYWRTDKVQWAQELDTDGTFDAMEFVSLFDIREEKDMEKCDNKEDNDNDKNNTNEAHVEFKVRIRNAKTGDETIIREKSLFLKEKAEWLYASGEARPEPVLQLQQ